MLGPRLQRHTGSITTVLALLYTVLCCVNGHDYLTHNKHTNPYACVPVQSKSNLDKSPHLNVSLETYADYYLPEYAIIIDQTLESSTHGHFDEKVLFRNLAQDASAVQRLSSDDLKDFRNFLKGIKIAGVSLGKWAGTQFVRQLAGMAPQVQDDGAEGLAQARELGRKVGERIGQQARAKLKEMQIQLINVDSNSTDKLLVARKRRSLYNGYTNDDASTDDESGTVFGQELNAMLDDLEPLPGGAASAAYVPDLDGNSGQNLMDLIYSGYVGGPGGPGAAVAAAQQQSVFGTPPDATPIEYVHSSQVDGVGHPSIGALGRHKRLAPVDTSAPQTQTTTASQIVTTPVAGEPVAIKIDLHATRLVNNPKKHHPHSTGSSTTTPTPTPSDTSNGTVSEKALLSGESRADLPNDLDESTESDARSQSEDSKENSASTTAAPSSGTASTKRASSSKPRPTNKIITLTASTTTTTRPPSTTTFIPTMRIKKDLIKKRDKARQLFVQAARSGFSEGTHSQLTLPGGLSLRPDSLYLQQGQNEGFERGLILGWSQGWRAQPFGRTDGTGHSFETFIQGANGASFSKNSAASDLDQVFERAAMLDPARADPYDVGVDLGYGLGTMFGYNAARKHVPVMSNDIYASLFDGPDQQQPQQAEGYKRVVDHRQKLNVARSAYETASLAAFRVALRAGFAAGVAFGPHAGLFYAQRSGARLGANLGSTVGLEAGLKAGGDVMAHQSLRDATKVTGELAGARQQQQQQQQSILVDMASLGATEVGMRCGSDSGRVAGAVTGILAASVGFHAYVDNSGMMDGLELELSRFELGALRGFKLGHAAGLSVKVNADAPDYLDPLKEVTFTRKGGLVHKGLPPVPKQTKRALQSLDGIRQDNNEVQVTFKVAANSGEQYKAKLRVRSWSIDSEANRVYFKVYGANDAQSTGSDTSNGNKLDHVFGFFVGSLNGTEQSRANESRDKALQDQELMLEELYKESHSGSLPTGYGVAFDTRNGQIRLHESSDQERQLSAVAYDKSFMDKIFEPATKLDNTPSSSLESQLLATAYEPKIPGNDNSAESSFTTKRPRGDD